MNYGHAKKTRIRNECVSNEKCIINSLQETWDEVVIRLGMIMCKQNKD